MQAGVGRQTDTAIICILYRILFWLSGFLMMLQSARPLSWVKGSFGHNNVLSKFLAMALLKVNPALVPRIHWYTR